MTGPDTSYLRAIGLVVRREFLAQVRTKAYRWSVLLMSAAVVLASVVFGMVDDDGPATADVAVVGPGTTALAEQLPVAARAAGLDVRVQTGRDSQGARAAVEAGMVDAALLRTGDGPDEVLVRESLDPQLGAALTEVVRTEALTRAVGADSAAVLGALGESAFTVRALDPPDPQQGERMRMAWVSLLLLLTTVLGFGVYVAIGVVEEKSTRVVELLLATIRPSQLLWGKVIGIGASALLQVLVIGAVALVAGRATGLITLTDTAVAVFAATLIWSVLGYLLFSLLYAAAGSLVSRQEEVQGVTAPLMLLAMLAYGLSIGAIGDPGGTFARVAGWIPPFSAFVMPIRTAAGAATGWEIAGAAVAMLLACALVSRIAARVYTRSVLHTGSRLSWRAALRG